jgi:electron transfer flavoprotein alpha subunit
MATKILVVADQNAGSLSSATAKVVSCALQLPDAEVHVVVFAADAAAANAAAQLAGVRRVLAVTDARHAHPLAALIAPQLAELAVGYSHVFGASTTFGRDLMPRVAALLDAPQLSDIAAVAGVQRFQRPVYAGNAVVTVEVDAPQLVATVRVASFQPVAAATSAALVESVQPQAALPTHTRFVSLSGGQSDRPDLQAASRVVSGGRAFASAENFQKLYKLADLLGAAVGASRAAVDAGFAPNELQVGQTGKIIAPELYMAFGISGAIQHLTGIKDARTIVAVNKDGEAPIFEVADIGLVGDVFTVLPELEQLLAALPRG